MKNYNKSMYFKKIVLVIIAFFFFPGLSPASQPEGDIEKIKKDMRELSVKLEKHDQTLSRYSKFYDDQFLISKQAIEEKLILMKQEEKFIEKLSTSVQIIALSLTGIGILATILAIFGFINLKRLFEEKLARQETIISSLQPILEDRAKIIAERDLSKFMESMYLRDEAVLNQRRANFIRIDRDDTLTMDKIIDIIQESEEFSHYVSRLFVHPELPQAENEILKSLFYFRQYPSFYIVPCLKKIQFQWNNNARIFQVINEVLFECENRDPTRLFEKKHNEN
jgi:hypothetical protein